MNFIQTINKWIDKFGPGKHGFMAGDTSIPRLATFVSADWFDDIQQEVINVIEGAGITPAPSTRNQMFLAIQTLIANATNQNYKVSCRFTTVANLALSGLSTQAGGDWPAALNSDDRILVQSQTVASQNGIYAAAAGAWVRTADADGAGEIKAGMQVTVEEGTLMADTVWLLATNNPIVIGTTSLVFSKPSGSGLPPGTPHYTAGKTAPSGSLKLNAAAISRTAYPGLFATLCPSGTVTTSIASPCVVAWPGNVMAAGDRFRLTSTGALPTGLTATTQDYYVSPAALSAGASFTFSNKQRTEFICSMTLASPGVITTLDNTGAAVAHGLAANEVVVFDTTGALYTGLTAGVPYFVLAAGLTSSAFQVATVAGGSAVNTSGTQSGMHQVSCYGVQINTSGAQSGIHTATAYPYGAGDGTTTFNLPEGRGEHIRGLDDGRLVDPRRVQGSWQADELKAHSHFTNSYTHTNVYTANGGGSGSGGSAVYTAAVGGRETRARNIAFLACITY